MSAPLMSRIEGRKGLEKKGLEKVKEKEKVVHVRGLIIYRVQESDGQGHRRSLEYLLLKKRRMEDWSPPKGKRDGRGESEIKTAKRETEEETGLIEWTDYHQLLNPKIYFEYRNSSQVFKKVTLWTAQLLQGSRDVILSGEHETYRWLPFSQAKDIIKKEYRDALILAHENITKLSCT